MMNETETLDPTLKQLLDRMVAAKQLASTDAATLARQCRPGAKAVVQSEEDILRWLAKEYDVAFATLDNIEPDRELLSLFPARVLLFAVRVYQAGIEPEGPPQRCFRSVPIPFSR